MIKKIYYKYLKVKLFFFSLINFYKILKIKFKEKKYIIVFDISDPQFNDFLEPVIRETINLTNNKKFCIFFSLYEKDIRSKKIKEEYFIRYGINNFIILEFLRLNFLIDFFFTAHFYSRASKLTLSINIPRGVGKWFVPPKNFFQNFDVHFSTGYLHKQQINDSIKIYNIKKKIKIFDIGFPKLDLIRKKNNLFNINKIKNKNYLNKNNFTILLSPAWEKGMILDDYGYILAEKILISLKNINLIVKLHPSSLVNKNHQDYQLLTQGKNWKKEFSKLKKFKNFKFYEETNSNEIMIIADIMITDVSSIAYEFLSLRKPVLYYDSPMFYEHYQYLLYKQYQNKKKFIGNPRLNPRINCGRNYGRVFKDISELISLLKFYVSKNTIKNFKLKKTNSIFFNEGKSIIALKESLIEIFKL